MPLVRNSIMGRRVFCHARACPGICCIRPGANCYSVGSHIASYPTPLQVYEGVWNHSTVAVKILLVSGKAAISTEAEAQQSLALPPGVLEKLDEASRCTSVVAMVLHGMRGLQAAQPEWRHVHGGNTTCSACLLLCLALQEAGILARLRHNNVVSGICLAGSTAAATAQASTAATPAGGRPASMLPAC